MNVGVKQESYRIETMMSNMRSECFNLCCSDLTSNELNMNEVHCIDRCAWRYLRTHRIISHALDKNQKFGK
ncbi:hypothetical protein STCU_00099 [Strigomonas culicis]|uniref:Mitochondrial import inner membrane translocase subunit n=1 Tax=Strigomonas culicis TaxID=28005 RepID=S9V8T2_9TRYP|nr:hypothetical protein STCU_00099 [Strigomonas culicis]|eukprot:EPY37198.1 hypothetical protein STCU_00099 [Strigomonas culicis]